MLTLVTGSTGLLGNNVVRLLLERHHQVKVLVRPSNRDPRPLQNLEVQQVAGDLHSLDVLKSAVSDVDLVIHCAGDVRIGWSKSEEAHKINAEGTATLARLARKANAKMVHVSTVNTLGLGTLETPANEDSPLINHVPCTYVLSKVEAEQRFQQEVDEGLEGTIVNPGFMLGPWDWKPSSGQMLLEVAQRFTPAAPPGGCSVVHVRRVAEGILSAAEHGVVGERYILAGQNVSYFELWKQMAEVSGGKPPWTKLGPIVRWASGACGDLVYRVRRREPLINSAAVRMSAQFHCYSSQKAIDQLNYQPGDAKEAIEAAWKWFHEHDYVKGQPTMQGNTVTK